MPVRQPRRIFRRAPGRRAATGRMSRVVLPGLLGLCLLGAVAAFALERETPAPAAAPPPPATIAADPQQVAVVDGDTLRLRDIVVRLRGVAAPRRGACGPAGTAHVTAAAVTATLGSPEAAPRAAAGAAAGAAPGAAAGVVDCGEVASATLAGLVRSRRVECRLDGLDSAGRPFGLCRADGVEINAAVVESGWARMRADARQQSPGLASAEATARAQRRGLWSAEP